MKKKTQITNSILSDSQNRTKTNHMIVIIHNGKTIINFTEKNKQTFKIIYNLVRNELAHASIPSFVFVFVITFQLKT